MVAAASASAPESAPNPDCPVVAVVAAPAAVAVAVGPDAVEPGGGVEGVAGGAVVAATVSPAGAVVFGGRVVLATVRVPPTLTTAVVAASASATSIESAYSPSSIPAK
jgi:hypothetical protein